MKERENRLFIGCSGWQVTTAHSSTSSRLGKTKCASCRYSKYELKIPILGFAPKTFFRETRTFSLISRFSFERYCNLIKAACTHPSSSFHILKSVVLAVSRQTDKYCCSNIYLQTRITKVAWAVYKHVVMSIIPGRCTGMTFTINKTKQNKQNNRRS